MTEKEPWTAMCGSMRPLNCSALLFPLSPEMTSARPPLSAVSRRRARSAFLGGEGGHVVFFVLW